MKTSVSRNECGNSKAEVEPNSAANKKASENNSKLSEPPKQDYIHVRARRGQATDSHSLAERVIRLNHLNLQLLLISHCLKERTCVFSKSWFGLG